MIIKEYAPGGILTNYIKSYRVVSSAQEVTNTVLPETSPLMTFRYKGEFHYIIHNQSAGLPAFALAGLRSAAKEVCLAKHTGIFIVKFKELAFASFFKEPLHYFFEKGISFEDLSLRHKISGVEDQLFEAEDDHERVLLVETFLTSLLKEKGKDQLMEMALQKIMATNGNIKIKELARSLNISLDAFEKRFRWAAGISPKRFSTIVKMECAVKNKSANRSITDLALNLGYFDESHFIKDFKSFSGQTPFQYFRNLY
jgi:AraC-like DNA-binding protein